MNVGDEVRYDNFGIDFHEGDEIYKIIEVTKYGFNIGLGDNQPIYAYEYQLRLVL